LPEHHFRETAGAFETPGRIVKFQLFRQNPLCKENEVSATVPGNSGEDSRFFVVRSYLIGRKHLAEV